MRLECILPENYSKTVQVIKSKDDLSEVKSCPWFQELATIPLEREIEIEIERER